MDQRNFFEKSKILCSGSSCNEQQRIISTLEIPSNEKLGHQSVLCNEREREIPPHPTCCYAHHMMRAVSDVM